MSTLPINPIAKLSIPHQINPNTPPQSHSKSQSPQINITPNPNPSKPPFKIPHQSPMSISFFNRLLSRRPILLYAIIWTAVLTIVVGIAAIAPEASFMWSISPSSSSACDPNRFVRVPLDLPSEVFCLPLQLFRRSPIDLLVPPLFAAILVAGSACIVRAFGL